jgi:hypothetical protein
MYIGLFGSVSKLIYAINKLWMMFFFSFLNKEAKKYFNREERKHIKFSSHFISMNAKLFGDNFLLKVIFSAFLTFFELVNVFFCRNIAFEYGIKYSSKLSI